MEKSSKTSKKKQEAQENKTWQEIKSWIIIIIIAFALKATIIEAYQVPTGSMENTILVGDFLLGNKFVYGVRTPNWIGIPWTKVGFHIPWFRLPAFKEPKQGDVVIFKYPVDAIRCPKEPGLNYIKRCIAGPGQAIEIKNKIVYVDGEIFEDFQKVRYIGQTYPPYAREPGIFPRGAGNRDNYGPVYVPAEGDTLYYGKVNTDIIRNVVELANHNFHIIGGKMYIDGKSTDYYIVEQDHYFMMGDNRHNSEDSRYWGFVPYDLVLGEALFIYFSWDKKMPLYRLTKKVRWNRIGRTIS
jgi:signal peptidase I